MESQLPSPSYVWGMLPVRFEIELTRHRSEICRLCGLYEEYGSDDGNFNAQREENEIIDELTKFLVQAVAEDAEVRQISNNDGPSAGRPGEAMSPYLAHALLLVYLRYHNSGGRKSVATSVDGKLKQEEAGPLFEFIKAAIEPLNRYLTNDLHRRPLSASRLARVALSERRWIVQELETLDKKAPEEAARDNVLNRE